MITTQLSFTKPQFTAKPWKIALDGPTGAGKTRWALEMATQLLAAMPEKGEGIGVIDTEGQRGKMFARMYEFQHLGLDAPYSPDRLNAALDMAYRQGIKIVVVDSLSHFWAESGGVLDMKTDEAQKQKNPNDFTAWAKPSKAHAEMISKIVRAPFPIIATMRAKMEYTLSANSSGRMVPTRIGLQPIQRDTVPYEFDIHLSVLPDHSMTVNKVPPMTGWEARQEIGADIARFTLIKDLLAWSSNKLTRGELVTMLAREYPDKAPQEIALARMVKLTADNPSMPLEQVYEEIKKPSA